MLYICEQTCCHFAFEAPALPDQCPECGGMHIHPAQEAEIQQFYTDHHRVNTTAYSGKADKKR